MDPVPKVMPLPADPDAGRVVDCAYTLAGDRMATCSASGAVSIYAVGNGSSAAGGGDGNIGGGGADGGSGGGEPTRLHTEKLGEQPTTIAWAPAELGSVCAVGTAQGLVHVLRAAPGGAWLRGGKLACGRGRVRCLAFAPSQQGLVLAAAGGDGRVYVHEGSLVAAAAAAAEAAENGGDAAEAADDTAAHDTSSGGGGGVGGGGGILAWTLLARIDAAAPGGACHCVAWRPFTAGVPPLLLAGSEAGAKAWCFRQGAWREAGTLDSPDGATTAVALHWAPTLGRPFELAAASFGSEVAVFRLDGAPDALEARRVALLQHPGRVWRVEFNGHGNALGASVEAAGGEQAAVWIHMPNLAGDWVPVSRIQGGAAPPSFDDDGDDAAMDP